MTSTILAVAALLASAPVVKPASKHQPKVQIAILLDNSGSMSGLINQARTQIWKVVNELANARRGNDRAVLEIALYEYGENPLKLMGFTRDLDAVSEKLFGIGIRGGEERCGEVIQKATRELEWSGDPDDLKLIYIAGNEPFTQGQVDYRESIAAAKRAGITVNPIHCGGREPTWMAAAQLSGGTFAMIDHNHAMAYVAAPQDAEIARLGSQLNQTYIGYGRKAEARKERQAAQDSAAGSSGAGAAVERSVAKSSAHYDNRDWDLVDAAKAGTAAPAAMPAAELPEEMKAMQPAEREKFVAEKAKERAALQKQIAELNAQREAFQKAERAKAGATDKTLDDAMMESVRTEAKKKSLAL